MNSETAGLRLGVAALLIILFISALIIGLFFLEYLAIGFFILSLILIFLAIAAAVVLLVMVIPMYALKREIIEEGSYSMDEVHAVENERNE